MKSIYILIIIISLYKTAPIFLVNSTYPNRISKIYEFSDSFIASNGKSKPGRMWKYDTLLYPLYEVYSINSSDIYEFCNTTKYLIKSNFGTMTCK
jgi:hypothetical protein